MSKQVIEFNGEAVGVVVPDANALRFVAVKFHVWDLDAHHFASAEDAREAVRRLVMSKSNRAQVLPRETSARPAQAEQTAFDRPAGDLAA
ncbi:hypothetical protein BJF92_00045 [Rhizobium rhizosphaerae]|uniref:Uncharacterized protein n=1 Tax=Xaviernesmea rhizosphaerae TaxID=1672749 RepID=A0A1Q9AE35_9HYPH|nr:hypothetical protein [Xaviernesmea rhizosphaerae]OLP53204.1 hypothetical protein BJF92_00045 [Xaviernesmea rhizosphaerae]OQP85827.1 hypothetical protein BTR14_13685 [Xaviernesmea rhizosphaerae]